MAPIRELLVSQPFNTKNTNNNIVHKNPKLVSLESLQRTISDISFELKKELPYTTTNSTNDHSKLPPISEVEDAKCECCGMSEECTPGYIRRVREKFNGKLICGLCSEAVKEEMEKNGGKRDEALSEHMSACVKFNRFGRTNPVLFQVEAMKEMLKKNSSNRAKFLSSRDVNINGQKKGGITRSSSCIPAITKDMNDPKLVN
ncbi:hypothetical protein LguiA_033393 [Lonicera macranthoides]